MRIERRLRELGLVLPQAGRVPPAVRIPFAWVRVHGDRAYAEVSVAQAYAAARLATLSMLSSIAASIGDLDRITAWLMISGMVNVAPGFTETTQVINGCSDLLLEVFGPDVGAHARTAIGMAQLPLDLPVIVAS